MGCLETGQRSGQRRARWHIGLFSREALRNATQSPPKRMQTVYFALLRDSQYLAGADPARARKGQGAWRPELREDRWGIARADVEHPCQARKDSLARDGGPPMRRVLGGSGHLRSRRDRTMT